jgi:hypothetical protein
MAKTVKVNTAKFKKDLERETGLQVEKAMKSVTRNDKIEVGEMKDLISKGVSPIARKGRFDAYKWAGAAAKIMKVARRLSGDRRAKAKQKAESLKKSKYPYSVQKEFPNKRERPVNLYLSGAFLSDLVARPLVKGVAIGFRSRLSELKEQGHREGVNGQPQRPIIPDKGEDFSPSVYRRIVSVVSSILKQRFKT